MRLAQSLIRSARGAICALAVLCGASAAYAATPEVPIKSGVKFVLAVDNRINDEPDKGAGILQGDYEMVVSLVAVDAQGIQHRAAFDGFDAWGVQRTFTVSRFVPSSDLSDAPLQIWGFHTSDPPAIVGTTALGPSLAVFRQLRDAGRTDYAFLRFASDDQRISGTLTRSAGHVKFPVLLNGRRVELDAIAASGKVSVGAAVRPLEMVVLDHPQYPVALRLAVGPRGGGFPLRPEFTREVVRIDFATEESSLAQTLKRECRVEVPGIYFDFNRATIRTESRPALQEMAAALNEQPGRAFRIEGHTDNIGSDAYNQDLSMRRAAAVKEALVRDFNLNGALLSTVGYGESRPLESNDTLAGRARNRRVELVCAEKG